MATLPVTRAPQATVGVTVRGKVGGGQGVECAAVAAPGVRLGPAFLTRRGQKPQIHLTQAPRRQLPSLRAQTLSLAYEILGDLGLQFTSNPQHPLPQAGQSPQKTPHSCEGYRFKASSC